MQKTRVFADTNVILEAFRTNCWKAISSHFAIETVEKCVEETLTGNPGDPRHISVPPADLNAGLAAQHPVTRKELASLVLTHPACTTLDDGEKHLLAWLVASKLQPSVLIVVTTADKAALVGVARTGHYRRRIITFRTELEGLIPTYGDLVAIAHDMPSWGSGGEIVAWDANTLTATTSEPLPFIDSPATHVIALRKRDGSVAGPFNVSPGIGEQQAIFAAAPDMVIETGTNGERTHYAFGQTDDWGLQARVIAVRPRGEQVEITCVAEHPAVHTADQI